MPGTILPRFCPSGETMVANIVGPICESSDTFAMNRTIDTVARGDLAVFRTAGAYGATMANTYNSRPLVPEVMVDGDKWAIVAERIEPATIWPPSACRNGWPEAVCGVNTCNGHQTCK
jgi:hypothetical protein